MADEITSKDTSAAKPSRSFDPRVRVHVYDATSKEKLPNPVPETWLDGRFPQLRQTPSSKKAGK